MKSKLFIAGNRIIKALFFLFTGLALVFALTSPNLTIGDNAVFGTSTTFATTYFVIGIIALIIAFYCYPKVQQFFYWLFIKHRSITVAVFVLGVLAWQIVFVSFLHPAIGWDVSAIHDALTDTTNPEIIAYYSLNQNNLPILLWQHHLAEWFSTTSWLFFDYVTLFLVNLSAVFNLLTIRLLSKKYLLPAVYLHGIWLIVFPWIIVPYTDTWVLPFVSASIFFYGLMTKEALSATYKSLGAVGLGIAAVVGYFIKPSVLILLIAVCLIELVSFFAKKWQSKGRLVFLTLTLITAGMTYAVCQHQLDKQTYIAIDEERGIPMIHFMNIGLTKDGGYSPEDALAMAKLPTKQEKIDYSKEKIRERLHEKGFVGYVRFLWTKHKNNTADGTFAWLKEGSFIKDGETPDGEGFTRWLQEGYYLYGKRIADFRFVAQLWWVICLLMIVMGWKRQSKYEQMLRLSIVGGFMFLLLFEGGRSRYLIQFLPLFLLLASLSMDGSIHFLKRIFTLDQRAEGDKS
ncbi:TIGR03766 family XrtG-associated glycosyltransferase [Enterococcus sp. DIV0876]|uniref:TIGR03766 family XrtG-associated glycosyltransferase n=1 Tax=Enterococcus sp. DIV0876 TaxID=2774633 RepID=UPI003D2FB9E9